MQTQDGTTTHRFSDRPHACKRTGLRKASRAARAPGLDWCDRGSFDRVQRHGSSDAAGETRALDQHTVPAAFGPQAPWRKRHEHDVCQLESGRLHTDRSNPTGAAVRSDQRPSEHPGVAAGHARSWWGFRPPIRRRRWTDSTRALHRARDRSFNRILDNALAPHQPGRPLDSSPAPLQRPRDRDLHRSRAYGRRARCRARRLPLFLRFPDCTTR